MPELSCAPCALCEQPATHAVTWPWGSTEHCCSLHLVNMRHRAAALGREITVVSLTPGAPVAISRDDRIRLHAEAMAANEEAQQTKERNRELFNANQRLAQEVRQLGLHIEELKTQLADARAQIEVLTAEKMAALGELAKQAEEVARLEGILHAEAVPA